MRGAVNTKPRSRDTQSGVRTPYCPPTDFGHLIQGQSENVTKHVILLLGPERENTAFQISNEFSAKTGNPEYPSNFVQTSLTTGRLALMTETLQNYDESTAKTLVQRVKSTFSTLIGNQGSVAIAKDLGPTKSNGERFEIVWTE